ncbi:MAG: hypothetical protein ACT4OF_14955 [Caulobacteraceae bacterium]
MLGGPLMYIGLCLVGWVMLWTRPLYGFLVTYAFGMLALIILVGALYGAIPATLESFRGVPSEHLIPSIIGFVIGVASFPIAFSIVGVAIVAVRKWMKARA